MASFAVNFPSVTFLVAVEVLLASRILPLLSEHAPSTLLLASAIVVINYAALLIWLGWLYPSYFHPLRPFPAPKVCRTTWAD